MPSAVKSAAPICFLLAFATAFGRTLSLIHAADIVQNAIMTIATDKISFLIVVIIAFFLLGMVKDTGPALIILAPILCPIAAGCADGLQPGCRSGHCSLRPEPVCH